MALALDVPVVGLTPSFKEARSQVSTQVLGDYDSSQRSDLSREGTIPTASSQQNLHLTEDASRLDSGGTQTG